MVDLCKDQRSWSNSITANSATPAGPSESPIEDSFCWVCLGDNLDAGDKGALIQPCKCAKIAQRYCHAKCLARWQLQSAGTRKETHCEFCQQRLPDWKDTLTPQSGCTAPAVMNVNFDGRTYSFEVKPGPEGYRLFTEEIRKAFNLPEDSELNITFTCDEPSSGSLLTLQGPGAYDAAVHCASVSASRRTSTGQPLPPLGGPGSSHSNSRSKSRVLTQLGRKLKTALSDLFMK